MNADKLVDGGNASIVDSRKNKRLMQALGEREIETIAKGMVADPVKFNTYNIQYTVQACHRGDHFERGRFNYIDDALLYLEAVRKRNARIKFSEETYVCVAYFETGSKTRPFARFVNVEGGAEFFFKDLSKKEAA